MLKERKVNLFRRKEKEEKEKTSYCQTITGCCHLDMTGRERNRCIMWNSLHLTLFTSRHIHSHWANGTEKPKCKNSVRLAEPRVPNAFVCHRFWCLKSSSNHSRLKHIPWICETFIWWCTVTDHLQSTSVWWEFNLNMPAGFRGGARWMPPHHVVGSHPHTHRSTQANKPTTKRVEKKNQSTMFTRREAPQILRSVLNPDETF